ncbi:MAG: L-threonylcarbamoyladenylate synthase [Candidatus Andersenbacteria bacterium]
MTATVKHIMKPEIINDIEEAVRLVQEGRVVAFPTGTSYGLAADALQGHALQRVRNLKQRPEEKTFTVCLNEDRWDEFFEISADERAFLTTHAGRSFTLLLSPKEPLKHLAQDGRVGLRMVDHPTMEEFVRAAQVPLTATSANIAGGIPSASPQEVQDTFSWLLDPSDKLIQRAGPTTYDLSLAAILDGGTLEPDKQSTIVRHVEGKWQVVRQGVEMLA